MVRLDRGGGGTGGWDEGQLTERTLSYCLSYFVNQKMQIYHDRSNKQGV